MSAKLPTKRLPLKSTSAVPVTSSWLVCFLCAVLLVFEERFVRSTAFTAASLAIFWPLGAAVFAPSLRTLANWTWRVPSLPACSWRSKIWKLSKTTSYLFVFNKCFHFVCLLYELMVNRIAFLYLRFILGTNYTYLLYMQVTISHPCLENVTYQKRVGFLSLSGARWRHSKKRFLLSGAWQAIKRSVSAFFLTLAVLHSFLVFATVSHAHTHATVLPTH